MNPTLTALLIEAATGAAGIAIGIRLGISIDKRRRALEGDNPA